MSDLVIHGLDDTLIEGLRARAVERQQSLEQMLRDVLSGLISARQVEEKNGTGDEQGDHSAWSYPLSQEERTANMQKIRAMTPPVPPGIQWPTTECMVREDRDNREVYR